MKCPACNNEVKGNGVSVKSSSGKDLTVCGPQCAQKINKGVKATTTTGTTTNTTVKTPQTPTPIGR
jgi:hypothetical protein